jgi:ribonuclease P protein component
MGTSPDLQSCRLFRQERLKQRKIIQQLFKVGKQKKFYPLALYYQNYDSEGIPYHKVLVSVPKKHFKKSVVRNKIRRRIREAYRQHKHLLYNKTTDLPFLLGYVYISKNVQTYKSIEEQVINSINYLLVSRQT